MLTLQRRYVYGPGVDEPIVMYQDDGQGGTTKTFYHQDRRGSVIALTDETGTVIDQYTYDAYGVPNTWTGNRIRFTGRWLDHETGLYYYRARFYSAGLGRFLQTDPIGYDDDMNLYAYVKGDPLNARDPSGEAALLGAVVGGGLELIRQGITGELQEAAGAVIAAANGNGSIQDAAIAVGSSLGQVGLAAGAGATGVGLGKGVAGVAAAVSTRAASSTGARVAVNTAVNVGGNAAAGAGISVAQNTGINAIQGNSLTEGATEAAVIGAAFGAAGSAGEIVATAGIQRAANASGDFIAAPGA